MTKLAREYFAKVRENCVLQKCRHEAALVRQDKGNDFPLGDLNFKLSPTAHRVSSYNNSLELRAGSQEYLAKTGNTAQGNEDMKQVKKPNSFQATKSKFNFVEIT